MSLAMKALFVVNTLVLAQAQDAVKNIAQRNSDNPFADFSVDALSPTNVGGCYNAPTPAQLLKSAERASFSFSERELRAAREDPSIDWRKEGAVGAIQQQHPFGTCWAMSTIAVTEAVNVIQGKHPFQKLSEQMVISCVPQTASGDNSDVLWSWALHSNGGKYQTEEAYPYNRTCNFFREQLLAPDGTRDGYPGTCNMTTQPDDSPCPPCPGVERKDGTPACHIDESKGFSTATVQGWGFIGPHGTDFTQAIHDKTPQDVTRMVAALLKYGPAQIGIDSSCVEGYTGGIITNCTSRNVDHAVAIVGADTDKATGLDYWLVRNSWNTTFGEDGYFRVQRDTGQMGIFGGYFGCYNKDCTVDP